MIKMFPLDKNRIYTLRQKLFQIRKVPKLYLLSIVVVSSIPFRDTGWKYIKK